MSAQLTVAALPAEHARGHVAQVLASLPVSLHPARPGAAADLVAVSGAPGWVARADAALDAGARGVVVADPAVELEGLDALAERAERAGVPVVVDGAWAHDPAVAEAAGPLAELDVPGALVEVRVDAATTADLRRLLLGQLALLRAAVAPVASLRVVRRGPRGYDGRAQLASGSRAALAAVLSGALPEAASLRLVRPERAVRLDLLPAATAAPGTVRVAGPDGSLLRPTLWESAHRAAWRRAHHLATSGGTSPDLRDLAEDARTAAGAW